MSFATKLSHVRYADGSVRDIMKKPKTDSEKISLPGILKVVRDANGIPTVYPEEDTSVTGHNLLETVWDNGPVASHKWDTFDVVRERTRKEWSALPTIHDPRSKSLHAKITKWIEDFKKSEHVVE